MDLFDLTGKVAVISGGGRGIGLMMARGLLQAGALRPLRRRDHRYQRETAGFCVQNDAILYRLLGLIGAHHRKSRPG